MISRVAPCDSCLRMRLCTIVSYPNRYGELGMRCNECLHVVLDDEILDLIYEKAKVSGPIHCYDPHEWLGHPFGWVKSACTTN
jgi:hypothetical protein